MFCCPRCSHLSTILNNIVEPESGVTILFNIVDKCEQRGQQNIVQSCFHQHCNNLSVFMRVNNDHILTLFGITSLGIYSNIVCLCACGVLVLRMLRTLHCSTMSDSFNKSHFSNHVLQIGITLAKLRCIGSWC
jgi:hypothetical protein